MTSADEVRVRAWLLSYNKLLRPALFTTNDGDPEQIHRQIIHVLGHLPDRMIDIVARLFATQTNAIEVAGIQFPGRVGVAAGLDKDAEAVRAWGPLGFGFAELGTVTSRAQPGNRPPRLFRLPHSHAIINRMGFNNSGAQAMAARLQQEGVRRGQSNLGIPFGISIGKSKVTPVEDAVDDYLTSLETLAPYADYIAVNVSSPNTPALRSLQERAALTTLAEALVDRANELDAANPLPIFVKIAPDMTDAQLLEVVEVCEETGISGLIATNTTIERGRLHPSETYLASQAGGLSGAPLTHRALEVVELVANHTQLPLMGVGGVMSPADAQAMFDAGAKLVQLYTGFIYAGPALPSGINLLCQPGR